MRYFTDCRTIEDVKSTYHRLCKELHPDNGGDGAAFVAMRKEYKATFERLKNIHTAQDGTTYEKETAETPEEFADIIAKVIFMEGVRVEIIGSWIWLSGNTIAYKDHIKAAGFWWSKSKKAWYHNGDTEHHKKRGYYSMNDLREKFGAVTIENEMREKIA